MIKVGSIIGKASPFGKVKYFKVTDISDVVTATYIGEGSKVLGRRNDVYWHNELLPKCNVVLKYEG